MKLRIMELLRSWLALEGAVPPGSARPQMSKHQHTELRDVISRDTCSPR